MQVFRSTFMQLDASYSPKIFLPLVVETSKAESQVLFVTHAYEIKKRRKLFPDFKFTNFVL